jgi:predicted enzyme involved in methoxymalonyl-ACP biosynthesis
MINTQKWVRGRSRDGWVAPGAFERLDAAWPQDVLLIGTGPMSCHALSRGVQQGAVGLLVRVACERSARVLIGEYLATPKHGPLSQWYRKRGLESVPGPSTPGRSYEFPPNIVSLAPTISQ